jgi:hypothetical protein
VGTVAERSLGIQPRTYTGGTLSQDDGIYILKLEGTKKPITTEYRIAHLFSVTNIFRDPSLIKKAFERSEVYSKLEDAQKGAIKLDDAEQTEHGILLCESFKDLNWSAVDVLSQKEHPSHVRESEDV